MASVGCAEPQEKAEGRKPKGQSLRCHWAREAFKKELALKEVPYRPRPRLSEANFLEAEIEREEKFRAWVT